ncbi:MAG: ADP-ribosylglycohydrolase family protein [Firmicutes bacterium]|nr:ADP-ribosylglycohydrolase family protein [Bacillota bacterium]
MFGAILGDIIGSPYEFDMGNKTKNFPLFSPHSEFTDDTVMTIAVAEALMQTGTDADDAAIKDAIIDAMHHWGEKYPDAGYGVRFTRWLYEKSREAYNSFGNGSAMRVSTAGWLAETLEDARRLARLSAEVTHNHPEGIKGAEATASAIWMARHGCSKAEIKDYIISEFEYDLSGTCDEIRPGYHHVESCQQTVPEAMTAFLEGKNFEDVIRTAVSLGGDCDTLTAIAGSIAEAFYGIPAELKQEAYNYLDQDLKEVLADFEMRCHFCEDVAQKYHPLYWFSKNENGFVQLCRPFGEPMVLTEYKEGFYASEEAFENWQKEKLYEKVFGV